MRWSPEVREENRKIRQLRLMVDFTIQILYQEKDLTFARGVMYIRQARDFAETLFPEKSHVFDLIYKPRMMRVLAERGLIPGETN
ncbi:MAG TPA: hypothetical protein ENJ66_06465 [Calditrichae bacterium]|nr:hypothetical protein [Calditrichia bacterium]